MREEILPEWLNINYVTMVLKQKIPDVDVVSFTITPAVLGGNNYCSRMWRVKVNYKDGGGEVKSISLMVKAAVPDGELKGMIEEGKFVEKEYQFYNEFVPKMYSIKENTDVIPKNYSSPVPETIVLDDLKEAGYVMCDRIKQLDFDHCRILLNTLATFHALSVAVAKEDPHLVNIVGKEHIFVVNTEHPEYDEKFKKCYFGFSNAIKNVKGFEKFEYISEDKIDLVFNKYIEIFSPRKGFNVLNHGDLWTNNILFKYNKDGNVIEAKLVDFQICKYASLGIDLNYFIWSSVQEDVRDNRIEELKGIYLNALNSNLEELGCEERLSEEQLDEELEFASFIGFFVLFVMLPLIVLDPEDSVHDQTDDVGNVYSMSIYKAKYYESLALKILFKLEKSIYNVFCNT